MDKLLAVTAIGPDRAGLIRDLSQAVTGSGGSIRESRMIALGSEFAVLMLVAGNWHTVNKIRDRLAQLQRDAGLTVTIRDTEPRQMEPSAPYSIDVVALDQEGIVLRLSSFFANRNLEIAEMNTRRYNAPHTGAPMFSVQMTINVPASVHVASLREEFLDFCDEQNLDAIMEPAQR
jgi:glycine cleavage system transcriptional repressor